MASLLIFAIVAAPLAVNAQAYPYECCEDGQCKEESEMQPDVYCYEAGSGLCEQNCEPTPCYQCLQFGSGPTGLACLAGPCSDPKHTYKSWDECNIASGAGGPDSKCPGHTKTYGICLYDCHDTSGKEYIDQRCQVSDMGCLGTCPASPDPNCGKAQGDPRSIQDEATCNKFDCEGEKQPYLPPSPGALPVCKAKGGGTHAVERTKEPPPPPKPYLLSRPVFEPYFGLKELRAPRTQHKLNFTWIDSATERPLRLSYHVVPRQDAKVVLLDEMADVMAVACTPSTVRIAVRSTEAVPSVVRALSTDTILTGGREWGCAHHYKGKPQVLLRRIKTMRPPETGDVYIHLMTENASHADVFQHAHISFMAGAFPRGHVQAHTWTGKGEKLRKYTVLAAGRNVEDSSRRLVEFDAPLENACYCGNEHAWDDQPTRRSLDVRCAANCSGQIRLHGSGGGPPPCDQDVSGCVISCQNFLKQDVCLKTNTTVKMQVPPWGGTPQPYCFYEMCAPAAFPGQCIDPYVPPSAPRGVPPPTLHTGPLPNGFWDWCADVARAAWNGVNNAVSTVEDAVEAAGTAAKAIATCAPAPTPKPPCHDSTALTSLFLRACELVQRVRINFYQHHT